MKENHITMILKKENRKNIENWVFGGFSKFEISKFLMISKFFSSDFSSLKIKPSEIVIFFLCYFRYYNLGEFVEDFVKKSLKLTRLGPIP